MHLISRQRLFSVLLLAMLACDGGPSGPSIGTLSVTVVGLPGGTAAAVTVTGPGGYTQSLSGSQTLTPLTAGTYTVTASDVSVGSASYSGNPATQTVSVGGSATAVVTYSVSSAGGSRLLVNINGLGSGTPAALTVTGPGFSQAVTTTQTLTGLASGTYTITAQDVDVGGTPYTASPSSQEAVVTTTAAATATVTYSPPPSGSLNLRINGMYLTQSTQKLDGSVPLVQNREGFLRVFVTANQLNAATPSVRIRFYQDFVLQSEHTINAPGLTVPSAVDESSLSYSWNVPVPGAQIRPGLSILAEVDIANSVAESDEMDNAFPAAAPLAMDVRTMPTLNVTLVPIRQGAGGSVGDVSNPNAFLETLRAMHPIDAVDVEVRQAYTTTATLQADGTGWTTVLNELNAIRVASPQSSRYWYGVAKVTYQQGVAGIAYVSTSQSGAQPGAQRTALGWDYLPTGSEVVAHELGHNWGRNHAPSPCVTPAPGNLDTQYPHSNGSVGAYGLDVSTGDLKDSTSGDVMSYCGPKWVGDYTYKAVLNYLSPPSPIVMSTSVRGPVQPSLLVWGHIRDGEMVLQPAFQVNTRPKLPQRPGRYSVEAKSVDGTVLFNLSFAPDQVADAPGNHQSFAFAVPLAPGSAARIATLRLSGSGREAVISASAAGPSSDAQLSVGGRPDSVEARRVAGGRVGLRWNARTHPMVMVRDAETGEVLSLAKGGNVQVFTEKKEVDLVLSDGVKSRVKRVAVSQ